MNIAALFIKRPVMTTLVMLAFLAFGIVAYRFLPVNDLPNVDFPTIQVSANLPGANPDTMASAVATPLERQFSTIAGIDSMTSTSGNGVTSITLQFALDRNIDAAAQDVQSAIATAARKLPPDMPSPPSFRKVNPADMPILYLAISSETLPLSTVDEYADTFMAQRISMISGVAQVSIYGQQKYAVRAQLDPDLLASRGIGIDEVEQAIQGGNVNLPTGTLYGPKQAFAVQTQGQLFDAAAYRPLIVAYRNEAPVRLGQLGRVIDDVEDDKQAGWFDNQRAMILAIQRQPGTNTIEVVDSIKRLLPVFRKELPASIQLRILFDRSVSIRSSVQDVKFTLMLTVFLVVMVIFIFLRNLSATLIPSLALPLSIIGTFAAMDLLGFSINNISLMALTLSVGFVVDDAIVMLENIVRHMEHGEGVMEAALKGSKEIGFTILSMTFSLVAVFIPVLFMGGVLGRILHEFAVTIAVAILISGFISLSLTPMLCSRFLRPVDLAVHGRLYQFFEGFFARLLSLYDRSLQRVLHHRRTTLAVTVGLVAGTAYLFTIIPWGFLPSEDTGSIYAFTEAAQGISYADMVAHQQEVAAVIAKDPNVDHFLSRVGTSGSRVGGNSGFFFISLKDRHERRLDSDGVIQELRKETAKVPGISTYFQNPPPIRIGGRLTKAQYQFTLQSPDLDELYRVVPGFEAKLNDMANLQDVTSDLQIKNPQVEVAVDRDQASRLGVSVEQIEDTLYSAYGSRQVSSIYAANDQYQVILEVEPRYQEDPAALGLLYVRSDSGKLVPLSAVARLSRNLGPLTINHQGQLPAVTLSFNLSPGVSLGEVVPAIEKLARRTLPATVSYGFAGTAQVFQSSTQGLTVLLILAIFVIYIVLGILYESFIHPLTILSGLPAAGFGALLTLLLFHKDLNVYAFVGVIMLVGIVKKNAIMMIDFALEAERNEGKAPLEAIYQGCLVRFRPIMMTTMAALMGVLPIALGFGAGSESRRPLGLAVVGGLLVSQLLTLYITPVVYYYMDKFQSRLGKKIHFRRPGAGQGAVEHTSIGP
jgi:HAE1 family hydrophobic/amphiphilic exporter-1